jgi:hypothetical protein
MASNTMITRNQTLDPAGLSLDYLGQITSRGFNWIGVLSECGVAGPAPLTGDPWFELPGLNGGQTSTHALAAGSSGAACEADEWRSVARPWLAT